MHCRTLGEQNKNRQQERWKDGRIEQTNTDRWTEKRQREKRETERQTKIYVT